MNIQTLEEPRRRATDPSKSLGQVAYEFMAGRICESHGVEAEELEVVGSMRWENQPINVQKDWEDTAQAVIAEFKKQVAKL